MLQQEHTFDETHDHDYDQGAAFAFYFVHILSDIRSCGVSNSLCCLLLSC